MVGAATEMQVSLPCFLISNLDSYLSAAVNYVTNRVFSATRYRDFGADVYGLNKNLQQLQKVFEDVQDEAGGPGIIPQSSSFYDTRALMTILDEPLRTLEDCDRLLRNRTYFAEDQGAAVNIYWNLAIEEEVTQLQHRVMFHNVKIAALLQPLQM